MTEVLEGLAGTKLRPKSPAHSGRLRGLIRQRVDAGVSPAEMLEDARAVTVEALDPPGMFATAVRREPYAPGPTRPDRPDWCGSCDPASRLLTDENGQVLPRHWCPVCSSVAAAL